MQFILDKRGKKKKMRSKNPDIPEGESEKPEEVEGPGRIVPEKTLDPERWPPYGKAQINGKTDRTEEPS